MDKFVLDHIGIAVKDLDKALKIFEIIFNVKPSIRKRVASEQVEVAVLELSYSKLELLQTTSKDGPIGRYIAKRGEGVHHLAFTVEDLNQVSSKLISNEINLVNKTFQVGVEGQKYIFVHPKETNGVLIEFCGLKTQGDNTDG